MRTFVIGGTGQVGSRVASKLAERGAHVRVLTRDPERASNLPSGQTGVVGDMLSVKILREEIGRADNVFVLFPPSEAISFYGLTVIGVAKECCPKRMVVMTGQDCAIHAPSGHIGSLIPIEIALGKSGIPHTLLNPNYFYQNDERQRERMLNTGIYGTPLGDVGLSRCDVGDIAEAAVASFERIGNERIRVCGPEVLTGSSVAATWSEALGREVRYGGHDFMSEFEERLVLAGTAPHWALDIRMMYESFQRDGLIATPQDVETLTELLGHVPRDFASYTREMAVAWRQQKVNTASTQW